MRIKFCERTVNQSQKVNHTKRYKIWIDKFNKIIIIIVWEKDKPNL